MKTAATLVFEYLRHEKPCVSVNLQPHLQEPLVIKFIWGEMWDYTGWCLHFEGDLFGVDPSKNVSAVQKILGNLGWDWYDNRENPAMPDILTAKLSEVHHGL
jgi:hypothetical protein